MQRLFETNVNRNAGTLPRTADTDIVFTRAPYIMYEQFQLGNNFITYLERTIQSKHVLRTRIKLTLYQKLFELISGIES